MRCTEHPWPHPSALRRTISKRMATSRKGHRPRDPQGPQCGKYGPCPGNAATALRAGTTNAPRRRSSAVSRTPECHGRRVQNRPRLRSQHQTVTIADNTLATKLKGGEVRRIRRISTNHSVASPRAREPEAIHQLHPLRARSLLTSDQPKRTEAYASMSLRRTGRLACVHLSGPSRVTPLPSPSVLIPSPSE